MGKLKKLFTTILPKATTSRVSAVVIICILAASVIMDYPATGASLCVFRNVTGKSCPGCGMTRGFVAMGHGHLGAAVENNPLSPIVYIYAICYLLWLLTTEWRLKRQLRVRGETVLLDITPADS